MKSSRLYRWGVVVAHYRYAVLVAWGLVLAFCAFNYPTLQRVLVAPNYVASSAESSRVEEFLEQHDEGSEIDALVFYARHYVAHEEAYQRTIASVLDVARHQAGVRSVLGPTDPGAIGQISSNEHAAVALLALGGDPRRRFDDVRRLQTVLAHAADHGINVWLTGYSPLARNLTDVETADVERAELIGVPIALLILLVSLGAITAALLPLLLAGAGLLLTYGVLILLAHVYRFDILLVTIVTMIGVGIGIDYSLFCISRFREELTRGSRRDVHTSDSVVKAVGASMATSGKTILISGWIVAFSLASLFIVNSPIFREIAVGALAVVACTLFAALTLLPAVLAILGYKINGGALPARLRPADVRSDMIDGHGGWARWAQMIMRHPIPAVVVVVTMLFVTTIPLLSLHYGINLGIASLSRTTSGKGEQVLTRSFTPGVASPIEVLVSDRNGHSLGRSGVASANALADELENNQQVFGVIKNSYKDDVLLMVVPTTSIDSPASRALVLHIRKILASRSERKGGTAVLVGGTTAKTVDIIDETRAKLLIVVGVILAVSLLFLVVIFRSIILPIKAIIMNLLATGATMGLLVVIFQKGNGEHLLDFTSVGFIQVNLPLGVFALLFGLSMDYEIFLIRRMQETWERTHDNRLAVATGVEFTGRPISTAAAIMVVVFGSFITANVLELKQFGFALAVSIAIDATLIRLVLVPALMCLLGDRNWWLPFTSHRKRPMSTTGSSKI